MQQSMDLTIHFKPGQILYIEHQGARLYAEVIQTVSDRKLCWVRPLALVKLSTGSSSQQDTSYIQWPSNGTELESVGFYDLRQGVDLVCPQSLFQIALDTEVIPVLAELNRLKPRSNSPALEENGFAHEQLREFIRQIWQKNPELFDPKLFN